MKLGDEKKEDNEEKCYNRVSQTFWKCEHVWSHLSLWPPEGPDTWYNVFSIDNS